MLAVWNTLKYEKRQYVIRKLLMDEGLVYPEIVLAIVSPWNEVVRQMATGDASNLAYTLNKWKDMALDKVKIKEKDYDRIKELGIFKDSADKFRKFADKMYGTNAEVHRGL